MDKITLSLTVKEVEALKNALDFLIQNADGYVDNLMILSNQLNKVLKKSRESQFDETKVYTSLNAGKLKAGSKVALADSIKSLKRRVKKGWSTTLERVEGEDYNDRFFATEYGHCNLAYLVEEQIKNEPATSYCCESIKHGCDKTYYEED